MGKNCLFGFFIFFVALIFNNTAFGGKYLGPSQLTPPDQMNHVVWDKNDKVVLKKDGTPIDCKIKFKDLTYVGLKFSGIAKCVYGRDDYEAKTNCSGRVINPVNKQYGQADGEIDKNPDGYYYCVRDFEPNRKQYACDFLAERHSDYLINDPSLIFRFERKNLKSTDGNCYCGHPDKNDRSKIAANEAKFDCSQEAPPKDDRCEQQFGLATVHDEERFKQYEKEKGSRPPVLCDCGDGKMVDFKDNPKKVCEDAKKATVQKQNTNPTAPDKDLKTCIEGWEADAKVCKQQANDAKLACDSKENKEAVQDSKETAGAIDTANKVYTQMNAGSGAQQECFLASIAANTAKQSLDRTTETCGTKLKLCTDSCDKEKLEEKESLCQSKISPKNEDGSDKLSQEQVAVNEQYYETKEKEINTVLETSLKTCGVEAKEGELNLSKLLSSIGESLKSSMTCMCQLSSTATSNDCKEIPSPNDCSLNPSNPACNIYGSLDVCTPGSNYNAHLCNCQMNPKSAGCPGYASGGLSNFASGTQIKNNSASSTSDPSLLAGGLKTSGSDVNLPGGGGDGEGLGLKLGSGTDGSAAGGGGGGGGSGGPSGGGSGAAAGVAPTGAVPEEKGFGALFGKAKNFLSKAFKGKNSKENGGLKSNRPGGPNANAFRPTRGIASKTGLGTKNQDIWLMMNKCFRAETCQNNNNSFLDSALKHK